MTSPDFFRQVEDSLLGAGFERPETDPRGRRSLGRRRRRRSRRDSVDEAFGLLTLTEVDGVLRWDDDSILGRSMTSPPGLRLGRGDRRRPSRHGVVHTQVEFERLEPAKIGVYLEKLDAKFSATEPNLLEWKSGIMQPVERVRRRGKILLLVHGTFSSIDHMVGELLATDAGRAFLADAEKHYDQILAFDHWTLSVSPVMNALDLARRLDGTSAAIHLVAHSRGGLVTRWWHEAFDGSDRERRLVLVGSPLGGTSLAAAPRLRAAINHLSNVARAVGQVTGAGSSVVPLLGVVSGLMRIVSSMGKGVGKTPVVDAVISMIPGLTAQARVGNNPELRRLRLAGDLAPERYFGVQANFQPKSEGWAFWRYFNDVGRRAANLGADLVFDAPNDLVVDTSSMSYLADKLVLLDDNIHDFGKTDVVHHLNYFRQPETLEHIRRAFEMA